MNVSLLTEFIPAPRYFEVFLRRNWVWGNLLMEEVRKQEISELAEPPRL